MENIAETLAKIQQKEDLVKKIRSHYEDYKVEFEESGGGTSEEEQARLDGMLMKIDTIEKHIGALKEKIEVYQKRKEKAPVLTPKGTQKSFLELAHPLDVSFDLDRLPERLELHDDKGNVIVELPVQKKFTQKIPADQATGMLFLMAFFEDKSQKDFKIKIPKSHEHKDIKLTVDISYPYGDGEKELVILVNGFSVDGSGGTLAYWGQELLETLEDESGYDRKQFITIDGSKVLIDHDPLARALFAKQTAAAAAPLIIKRLSTEGINPKTGKINRKIIIISHSKGSIFAEMFEKTLIAIIQKEAGHLFENPKEIIDIKIHFEPYQVSDMAQVEKQKGRIETTLKGGPTGPGLVKSTVTSTIKDSLTKEVEGKIEEPQTNPTIVVARKDSPLGGIGMPGAVNIEIEGSDHSNESFNEPLEKILEKHQENTIEGNDNTEGYDGLLDDQTNYIPPKKKK